MSSKSTLADTKRGEVHELRLLLSNPRIQSDVERKREVIKKVIAYMTLGIDVSGVFAEMIMSVSTRDIVNKKMIYLYLSTYARKQSGLAILLINTLQKDSVDDDPMIRGLALRTLCSLRLPNTEDYVSWILPTIRAGLVDTSGYVRKTAVMGVAKLAHIMSSALLGGGSGSELIGQLSHMLANDNDPNVVCNIIYAMTDIHRTLNTGEDGLTANTQTISLLLNRLHQFSEWGQCMILELLSSYTPPNEDTMYDIMNLLEDRLKIANAAVVLATIKVYLRLTMSQPALHQQVYERLKDPLITLAGGTSSEMTYAILAHIHVLVRKSPDTFRDDYQAFFIRHHDPAAIKQLKLQILTLLCNEANYSEILLEFSEYVNDYNPVISSHVIQSIGTIAIRIGQHSKAIVNECIEHLISCIESQKIDTINTSITVIHRLLHHYPERQDDILQQTITIAIRNFDELNDSARVSLVWLLGYFSVYLRDAPYLLESLYIDSWTATHNKVSPTLQQNGHSENDVSAHSISDSQKHAVLLATVTAFFERPAEVKDMLTRVLKLALNDNSASADSSDDSDATSLSVRDRALLYVKLLQLDIEQARKVIVSQYQQQSQTHTSNNSSEYLTDDAFNTLSVIFQLPAERFLKPITELQELDEQDSDDIGVGAGGQDAVDAIVEPILPADEKPQPDASPTAQSASAAGTPQQQAATNGLLSSPLDLLSGLFSDSSSHTSRPATQPTLQLQPSATVDKQTYQSKWQSLPVATTLQLTIANPNSTSTRIESRLQANHILTFASGKIQGTMKYYFYARELQSQALHLIEGLLQFQTGQLNLTLKSESTPQQSALLSETIRSALSSLS